MVKLKQVDSLGKSVYTIEQVNNWNEFVEWLYKLDDEEEIQVSVGGKLFHFRTHEERIQFLFGFQCAWNIIDDTYLEKSNKGE